MERPTSTAAVRVRRSAPTARTCTASTDCQSGVCNQTCRAATCGNGVRDSGEDCEGTDLAGASCTTFGYDNGTLACTASCTYDKSACFTCDNGTREATETCDGVDLNGATCASAGFTGGVLQCNVTCDGYDTSGCYTCGNGMRELLEACDGADLSGQTCVGLGFDTGTLACAADCAAYDTTGCSSCGNGVINGSETCDGAALNGASRAATSAPARPTLIAARRWSASPGPAHYSDTARCLHEPSRAADSRNREAAAADLINHLAMGFYQGPQLAPGFSLQNTLTEPGGNR